MKDLEGGSLLVSLPELSLNGVISDLVSAYHHTHLAFSFGVVIVFQINTMQESFVENPCR